MNYQRMFKQVVGVTLALVLVGLLSATAYAAGPGPGEAYQVLPAANHCAGLTNDAAGSTLLGANPELSTACRYASMVQEKQAADDPVFPNFVEPGAPGTIDEAQRARQAETARYSGLAEAYTSRLEMSDSRFLAENPEAMRARHYTAVVSGFALRQKMDPIQRFGLAEVLADEKETASAQQLTIDDIRRLDLTEYMEAAEK